MFSKCSEKIADKLQCNNIIDVERYEICRYGINQLFTTILDFATILFIGFVFNMVLEGIIFTAAYIPIRIYAGGYHAKSPQRCWMFSAIMLLIVLCIIKYTPNNPIFFWIYTVLSLISCVIIWTLSPVEDKNKILDEQENIVYRQRTRRILYAEISLSIILYALHCYSIVTILEMVWFSLSVMLILGIIKNKK
jgi:hypothetical protein CLOSPO_01728